VDKIEDLHARSPGRVRVSFGWGTLLTNDFRGLVPGSDALAPFSLVCKAVAANGPAHRQTVGQPQQGDGPRAEIERYKRVFGVGQQERMEVVVARFDLRSIETAPQDDIEDDDLAGLVRRVLEAESSLDATLAHYPEILERGLRSPVPVLRIAALAAALLLTDAPAPRLLAGVSWFLARLPELDEVTRAMLGVLVQRVAQPGPGGPPPPAVAASPGTRGAGLVLVHGTHLPFNTPPDWHLPGSGGFHSYVSATRADTYAAARPSRRRSSPARPRRSKARCRGRRAR
jgi:hypothetical protein